VSRFRQYKRPSWQSFTHTPSDDREPTVWVDPTLYVEYDVRRGRRSPSCVGPHCEL
jgi:hypothetical protein